MEQCEIMTAFLGELKKCHVLIILRMAIVTKVFCPQNLQDILKNESIKLDWIFKYSLMLDIVKVKVSVFYSLNCFR